MTLPKGTLLRKKASWDFTTGKWISGNARNLRPLDFYAEEKSRSRLGRKKWFSIYFPRSSGGSWNKLVKQRPFFEKTPNKIGVYP